MILWDDEAIKDLQEIYDYIYRSSPQNAEMVIDRRDEIANSFSNFPLKFPKDSTFKRTKIPINFLQNNGF